MHFLLRLPWKRPQAVPFGPAPAAFVPGLVMCVCEWLVYLSDHKGSIRREGRRMGLQLHTHTHQHLHRAKWILHKIPH